MSLSQTKKSQTQLKDEQLLGKLAGKYYSMTETNVMLGDIYFLGITFLK